MGEDNCWIEVINDDGSVTVIPPKDEHAYDSAPPTCSIKAELPPGWEDQLYEEMRDRRFMQAEMVEVGA